METTPATHKEEVSGFNDLKRLRVMRQHEFPRDFPILNVACHKPYILGLIEATPCAQQQPGAN
jgi:hypothetical protein